MCSIIFNLLKGKDLGGLTCSPAHSLAPCGSALFLPVRKQRQAIADSQMNKDRLEGSLQMDFVLSAP